jgi:NADPH:quinone reductase-like Zn-dependent oxidoreductase
LLAEFEAGTLKPLPAQTFSLEEVGDAFQYMARAKHIGKVVVTQFEASPILPGEALSPVEAGATYLVTGGLGGLGTRGPASGFGGS